MKNKNINELFSRYATVACEVSGNAWSFLVALLLILGWLVAGPIFGFSDTWQLVINTSTSIVTFLMVFLIQHTQNRDTKILKLKLDELIKSHENADNVSIDLDKLNDDELKKLENDYKIFCRRKK